VHGKSNQAGVRRGRSDQHQPAQIKAISLPVLCGFIVATICFGAARIHASGSIASNERPLETPAITTRLLDFQPNAIAPSAFADWSDQPATVR
jgi:hypothetical protein